MAQFYCWAPTNKASNRPASRLWLTRILLISTYEQAHEPLAVALYAPTSSRLISRTIDRYCDRTDGGNGSRPP